MYPLNHVVAYIHWIDIRRHDFDAKSIPISDCCECLVPPTRSFYEGRAYRLGRSAIDVINNRLDWLTNGCIWVFLLQAMACDETFRDRLLDRSREIHVINAKVTGTRIKLPRFETWTRKLNKRMSITHCDCLWSRDNLSNKLT